jgi:opacity protein-like surface antigen
MRTGERLHTGGSATRRLVASACALACLTAAEAGAQSGKGDYIGSWSGSAAIGYAIPNTDEYDNAFAWRLAAGYSPTPQFEIDLEVSRFVSEVSQPDPYGLPSHTIASGELDVTPVCLTAQYRTPLPGLLSTLSLLAGVGYYFIDYSMDDEPRGVFVSGGAAGHPDQHVDDAWGFHVGAGLEYALTVRLSVSAEGRYVFLSPQASGTTGSGSRIDDSLDLNTWVFTGGIKVAF